jgi:hypothetical protein
MTQNRRITSDRGHGNSSFRKRQDQMKLKPTSAAGRRRKKEGSQESCQVTRVKAISANRNCLTSIKTPSCPQLWKGCYRFRLKRYLALSRREDRKIPTRRNGQSTRRTLVIDVLLSSGVGPHTFPKLCAQKISYATCRHSQCTLGSYAGLVSSP